MPDRLAKHCANSGRLNRLEPFFCTPPEKGRFCKRRPHLGACCVVYFMNEINTDAIGSAGWLFLPSSATLPSGDRVSTPSASYCSSLRGRILKKKLNDSGEFYWSRRRAVGCFKTQLVYFGAGSTCLPARECAMLRDSAGDVRYCKHREKKEPLSTAPPFDGRCEECGYAHSSWLITVASHGTWDVRWTC